jgi:uncharacterized protein YprB with RNaseH-like and TPR domain
MSLRDRLEQIHRRRLPADETPAAAIYAEPPLESLVAGIWRRIGDRRCFMAEQIYPLHHRHGDASLGNLARVPHTTWEPFVRRDNGQPFDPRRALYIDTETTGLLRGPGTYVFLVGVGSFQQEAFRVRQYFMPDYGDEEALLALLREDLDRDGGLVSFNGRAFDWPLIQMRYALRGDPLPSARGEPHLDLLFAARRLWGKRLASCALGSLEHQVLSVQREGLDVPGYMIPQLYADYVTYGRTRPMARVFYHNRVDILSLVTLASRIGHIINAPETATQDQHFDPLALARLFERCGQADEAIAAYRLATESESEQERHLAREQLSFLLKRLRRYDEAIAIWQAELDTGAIYPYVELAKYHEHQMRDYQRARVLTREAIDVVRSKASGLDLLSRREWLAALQHRLARLDRRLRRHGKERNAS